VVPAKILRVAVDVSLAFLILSLLFGKAAAQDTASDHQPLTVVLHVFNQAQLVASDLARAENEATNIYKAAWIRLLWVNVDAEALHPQSEALNLSMLLLGREAAQRKISEGGLGGDVLGRAARATARGYIFSHRIGAIVAEYSRQQIMRGALTGDFGLVLGRVVAHELGHLLLPIDDHADAGLMRATLDLSGAQPRFTREQVRLIHETIRADLAAKRPATRHPPRE
jgi:hypothetical protein